MRPVPDHRKSRQPVAKPEGSSTPIGNAMQRALHGAPASPDLATRIVQARRDALSNPARAALLLRSWMSDNG